MPPGQPQFGAHIERIIGILMTKIKALPRATGHSIKNRKNYDPEKAAALILQENLQYVSPLLITDNLGSYAAAKAAIMPDVLHRQSKRSNNRAEIRISRRTNASDACADSNRPDTRDDSCRAQYVNLTVPCDRSSLNFQCKPMLPPTSPS